MTHTNWDNPPPDPPTSRDGIDSWLDVLTSMLSLPPSQRTQVRDELEDHLRSRVDDLLIASKPEPEAIRIAIAELGETAQLARHISSANRTPKSFRRFAMNATFFVLAGSILTASVSMMMPNTAPLSNDTTIIEQLEHRATESPTAPDVRGVFIDKSVLYGTLEQLAATFDREFIVSNNAKRTMMDGRRFGPTSASLEGDFTLEQAISRVRQIYVSDLIDLAITTNAESIELLTQAEYERSRVVINAYPIPAWAESNDEQVLYARSIEQLISTKHDLEYTTIQPINGSLVVAAPPRVHAEIVDMSDQLQAIAVEMRARNEVRHEQQRAQKQQQLKNLKREYETAKAVYQELQRELSKKQGQHAQLEAQRLRQIREINPGEIEAADELEAIEKLNDEYAPKLEVLRMLINEFQFEIEEKRGRFERLQQILIDTEAEVILSELNNPFPVDSRRERSTSSPVIYITGPNDVRSGIYQLPESGNLTLSRFLFTANAQGTDGKVTLERDGNTRLIGTTNAIISGEIADITLLPDDEIAISAAD